MVDHVGDIDDHVGNNNFNDLHALLDIKGSVASRSSASKIPSRIDIPSESILNGPV